LLPSFNRLGVPYHSWRITHAKHHASTAHMTQDQVFVPKTRSELGLPPFDPTKEDIYGGSVTEEVKKELWEALGDSPIGASLAAASYLVGIAFVVMNRFYNHEFPSSWEVGLRISFGMLLVSEGIPNALTVS
jgi:omega-6 fatty acid desaturase (delta-12 desaturase)